MAEQNTGALTDRKRNIGPLDAVKVDEGVVCAAAFLTAMKHQNGQPSSTSAAVVAIRIPGERTSDFLESAPQKYLEHNLSYRTHNHVALAEPVSPSSMIDVSVSRRHYLTDVPPRRQYRSIFAARGSKNHGECYARLNRDAMIPRYNSSTNADNMATTKRILACSKRDEDATLLPSNPNSRGISGTVLSPPYSVQNELKNIFSSGSVPLHESDVPPHFVDRRHELQLRHLLTLQDRHLTTQFTASIIDQLDFVYFEEGDRRSHRTHLPIGFRGICCRHCKAPAGKCGRFFPSSLKTLSDTQKTLYTLHRHFIKCQHVPDDVNRMLHKLRENHMEERKTLKGHGSQRAFFRGIWAFLGPEAEGGSIACNESDKNK